MKKTIILFFAVLPLCAAAQVEAGLGAGYNTKDKTPIANVYLGVAGNGVHLDLDLQVPTKREINLSVYSGVKAGFDVLYHNPDYLPYDAVQNSSLIIYAGAYYNKVSSDHTEQNNYVPGFSAKYIRTFKNENGVYLDAMYINKSFLFSAGMHVVIN